MWSYPGYHTTLLLQPQCPIQHPPYIFQQFGYPPTFPIPFAPQMPIIGYFPHNSSSNSASLGFTVPHVYNTNLQHTMAPTHSEPLRCYDHTPKSTCAQYDDEFLFDTLDANDTYFHDNLPMDHSFFTNRLSQLHVDTTLPSLTISSDKCEMICSNQCTISISPSIDISLNELSIPPSKPISNEIRTYSPLSILPLTLKTPLSVTNNTSHSTPSTIDDYLEDYRIFITIFLTAWRSGQLTGITQLSKLLECPEFKRMDQRFLYSDHGATLTGLDGLSFNGFTNQWIFRPPP